MKPSQKKPFVVEHRKLAPKPKKHYEPAQKCITVTKYLCDEDVYMTYGRSVSKVYSWGK